MSDIPASDPKIAKTTRDFMSLVSQLKQTVRPEANGFAPAAAQAGGLMVYIYDASEDRVIYATQDCRDLLGSSTDALLTNSRQWILEHVHENDRKRVFENRERLLDSNGPDNAELYFTLALKNQRMRLHRRESVLNRDSDGYVRQILGTLRDISRPNLNAVVPLQSEAIFRNIFDALPHWIILTDTYGNVLMANAQAREMLARLCKIEDTSPLACLKSENCRCELDEADAERVRAFYSELQSEGFYRDHKGIKHTVHLRDITGHCEELPEDYRLQCIEDISQQRITEEKLRQTQGESEKLNKLLTDTLQKLANKTEEAEKADRAKTAFLAVMSHELRTPMNAILGLGNLLLEDSIEEGQRELLNTIVNSATSLLELIEHILEYAEHEAGNISYREDDFSLRDMVARLKEEQYSFFAEKRLNFNLHMHDDVSDRWIGDAQQIERVLRSLLSNAVKFTSRGSIEVSVSLQGDIRQHRNSDNLEQATLDISVRDTGMGIREDQLEQVFTPFFQVDSAYSRRYGGVGLGLTIARSIARNLRGRISAESIEGKGSTFRLSLPLKRQKQSALPKKDTHIVNLTLGGGQKNFRVLLASPEVETHLELTSRIEQGGHTVESVRGVEPMMRALNMRIFDVVIIDKQMPHLDLMALVERIRSGGLFPQKRDTRIVALDCKGSASVEEQTQARQGSFSWLSKSNLAGQLLPLLTHR